VNLALDQIRMDGGTQSRAQLDWVAIDEYAAAMKDGEEFPPIVVFFDGTDYWLADGFHRVRAAQKAGLAEIAADVRQGTRRDAVLHSVGANANNGVRRTARDRRQAVTMLIDDEEWTKWSS
jgi:ParB-like chromosome segregation protein Spo0J